MVYVNEDILVQILLRLPVICLLRCMCVCKAWFNLIKSPRFVDLHLQQKNGIDYFIYAERTRLAPSYLSLDSSSGDLLHMSHPPSFPAIIPYTTNNLLLCGPCNGLFCVVAQDRWALNYQEPIFMYNPATRESLTLPSRPRHDRYISLGTSARGLGYDSRTNDYKLVTFVTYYPLLSDVGNDGGDDVMPPRPSPLGIYSLASHSWREVEIAVPRNMKGNISRLLGNNGLFLKGCLHWIGRSSIIWFDISNEVMGEFPSPAFPEHGSINAMENLVVLDDCLALVMDATFPLGGTHSVTVWKMADHGGHEAWTKTHSISIPYTGPFGGLFPIHIWKDRLFLVVPGQEGWLVSLKLGDEEGDQLKLWFIHSTGGFPRDASIILRESLVPLRGRT